MNTYEMAKELIRLTEYDYKVREEIKQSGDLYSGYHPKLEAIHIDNAHYLMTIMDEIGFPTVDKVGEEASVSAWHILLHAISLPDFQRQLLPILIDLALQGQVNPVDVAMLYDRICYFENRPQKFGTQFDFDEQDILNPWPIENDGNVDELRSQLGLPPITDIVQRMRELAKNENEEPIGSYEERQQKRLEWCKQVGWLQ